MLRKGFAVEDSIGRTAGTAGAGMVFAGTTLILAVTGLALTGSPSSPGSATRQRLLSRSLCSLRSPLVPALFGLMKMRVLPKKDRAAVHHDDTHLDEGIWARIADAVTTKPWRFAIGSILLLLLMAFPVTKMEFGQMDSSFLPTTSTGYQANQLITEGSAPATTALAVVVQMNKPAKAPRTRRWSPGSTRARWTPASRPSRRRCGHAWRPDRGQGDREPRWRCCRRPGHPHHRPPDPATQELVTTLREEVLPRPPTVSPWTHTSPGSPPS